MQGRPAALVNLVNDAKDRLFKELDRTQWITDKDDLGSSRIINGDLFVLTITADLQTFIIQASPHHLTNKT